MRIFFNFTIKKAKSVFVKVKETFSENWKCCLSWSHACYNHLTKRSPKSSNLYLISLVCIISSNSLSPPNPQRYDLPIVPFIFVFCHPLLTIWRKYRWLSLSFWSRGQMLLREKRWYFQKITKLIHFSWNSNRIPGIAQKQDKYVLLPSLHLRTSSGDNLCNLYWNKEWIKINKRQKPVRNDNLISKNIS